MFYTYFYLFFNYLYQNIKLNINIYKNIKYSFTDCSAGQAQRVLTK